MQFVLMCVVFVFRNVAPYSQYIPAQPPLVVNVFFVYQESVLMQFCGNKLDKKDFFGKSDPFLVFYRSNEDGT